ncbi:MAG TPA: TlpA disulfide reductase family protein [Bryobacteraceae bacterium]|nr:TlpA disulfide reductase family protein [Bryobacteraceae bacterium]
MRRRDFCTSLLPAAAVGLLHGATLPRPASNLVIHMPNGRAPLQLSQFRGKVIAVEFLLTYCSHCQRASRTTDLIYRDLGAKGFVPVGAAINPGGDVTGYVRDHNITFQVGSVPQESCMSFLQIPPMGKMMMPQVAFIDRSFNIVAQHSGDEPFFGENEEKNMRDLIENLLKPARKKS